MEDKFDKKIAKMLNEDIYIPQKITNRIKTTLKEERKGEGVKMRLNKIVATVAGIIIVGAGVVFAGKEFIDSRFNSINEARDNGGFEKVGGEYIKNDGLGIKIQDYFLDTTRVGITFDIQTDDAIDEVRMFNVSEQTNVPGACDIIRFIDKKGNEIPYKQFREIEGEKDSEGGPIGYRQGATFGDPEEQAEKNRFNMTYLQYPNEDYSQADKMRIVIKRITTKKDGKEKEYKGNWEFEIDIADKYLDKSENITYNASIGGVVVGKAELSTTELVVKINSAEANEAQKTHKEEIDLPPLDDNLMYMPRIVGEDGQEITNVFTSNTSTNDEGSETRFNLSKFSAQNSYKIIFHGGMVVTLTK